MRIFTMALILLAWGNTSHGQVIITSRALPELGDTLNILTDLLPEEIDFGQAGPNQRWDFNKLKGPYVFEYILRPAVQGTAYTMNRRAQAVVTHPDGYEIYYAWDNNTMNMVGYHGYDFTGLGLKLPSYFVKPYVQMRVPMRYGQKVTSSGTLIMPVPKSRVPAMIFKKLPYTPDSVRFILELEKTETYDAYGNLDLYIDYPALRVTQKEILRRRLEVRSASIPWQDVTILFKDQNFMATDSVKRIIYYANESKVPVVEALVHPVNNTVSKINFTSHPYWNEVSKVYNIKPDLFAYPNPTLGKLRFDFLNLPSGYYRVKVFSLIGVKVWEQNFYIDQNISVKADLTSLPKGSYLYALINEQDKTIVTKRLIIFNP